MTSGEVSEEVVKKAEQPKSTELGLYLTSTEVYDLLSKDRQNTLFIDVRTQGEIASEGMPSLADANIPYFNKQKELDKVKMVLNQNFVPTFEEHLKEKGLDKQSRIFLICRRGNRSAKAVNALAKLGYQQVYHIVDGTNGWKNSNLPFTNPEKNAN
jgi:rhodanese-related sulfurtransferase